MKRGNFVFLPAVNKRQFLACSLAILSWPGFEISVRAQSLPATYDLRSVLVVPGETASWVAAVQDQGQFNDCWTFATATAIDSNLLMNGYFGASVSTPPTIQISSWHLSTANGFPESLVGPNYGENGEYGWGGFEYQALGYMTRGSGAWAIPAVPPSAANHIGTMGGGVVLNSANPANAYPAIFDSSTPANIGYLIPPAQQAVAFQARAVVMLDQGFSNNVALPAPTTPGGYEYDFTQGAADPQVARVKAAMQQYGAVTTSMNADYSYFSFADKGDSTYTVNYVNPGQNPYNTDHEVTIIGWDDNYTVPGSSTPGAWIVQNSWGKNYWTGTDRPNDGTFYVSYNDASIGRTGVSAFQMEATGNYGQTVLQNELGPMGYAYNYADGSAPMGMAAGHYHTVASVLTPHENGMLIALGVATQVANVGLTLEIFGDWGAGGPTDLLLTQNFTLDEIGYQLLDLSSAIALLSENEIVIKLTYSEVGAASIVIGGSGLNGYLDVPEGLSYFYDIADSTWKDYADVTYEADEGFTDASGGIVFLKGVTAVPEPSAWALLVLGGIMLTCAVQRKIAGRA